MSTGVSPLVTAQLTVVMSIALTGSPKSNGWICGRTWQRHRDMVIRLVRIIHQYRGCELIGKMTKPNRIKQKKKQNKTTFVDLASALIRLTHDREKLALYRSPIDKLTFRLFQLYSQQRMCNCRCGGRAPIQCSTRWSADWCGSMICHHSRRSYVRCVSNRYWWASRLCSPCMRPIPCPLHWSRRRQNRMVQFAAELWINWFRTFSFKHWFELIYKECGDQQLKLTIWRDRDHVHTTYITLFAQKLVLTRLALPGISVSYAGTGNVYLFVWKHWNHLAEFSFGRAMQSHGLLFAHFLTWFF